MEEMIKNPYALFAENQETYEEAVKKSTDESQSFQRTKHFRMDSQVFLIFQLRGHCIRNISDTELNRGTIFHQGGVRISGQNTGVETGQPTSNRKKRQTVLCKYLSFQLCRIICRPN